MSDVRLIKKYFKFLKCYGFKRKVFTRNGDCEITYSKKDVVIEVCYEWGIPYLPLSNNINEVFKDSSYVVYILIKKGYQGGNILFCDMFDKQSRKKLKSDIEEVKKDDLEKLLQIYSQFIMQNISKLI